MQDYQKAIANLGHEYFADLQEKLEAADTFDTLVEGYPFIWEISQIISDN